MTVVTFPRAVPAPVRRAPRRRPALWHLGSAIERLGVLIGDAGYALMARAMESRREELRRRP